jgi:putative peptidoglycan lipid II flippase
MNPKRILVATTAFLATASRADWLAAHKPFTIFFVPSETQTVHRRIAVATVIVTTSVLLSRLLGFFREWAVAHQIGPGVATDAYYAAFTIPDFLNYLVAGGSLSVTFIPVFAKYVAENREEEGWRVFSTVVTVMGFLLVGLVLVGELFANRLAHLIAPGFGPKEGGEVAFLTRIMLPAQICFYEGSILSAVQYAKGQFVVPSLAPLIYNAGIILGGMLLSSRIGITGFSIGVLGGALVGNLLLQVYGATRAGARFSPNVNVKHPGFWLFMKLSIPIMLAVSLSFTDDWIIRIFGSYLEAASITWLSYGKILMRVPLGLVGQAIGIASFPILAQLYSEKKFGELNNILNSTFKVMIFLLVPISAFTIVESQPLVRVAFAHTRMHGPSLTATGIALALFSIGMFGWGSQYILARGFYATRDTITPAVVGTVMTGLNIPLYWYLVHRAQYRGLALASSIGIIAYTIVLFVLLNRRTQNHESGGLVVFFGKVALASAGAGAVCYALEKRVMHFLPWQRAYGSLGVLVIASAGGIIVLMILMKLLHLSEFESYMKRFLRVAIRKMGRTTSPTPGT